MNKNELKEMKDFSDKSLAFAENILKFAAESEDKTMLFVLVSNRKKTLSSVDFKKWTEPEEDSMEGSCRQILEKDRRHDQL